MAEGKSLDEAMLETLGKATEEAETGEQPAATEETPGGKPGAAEQEAASDGDKPPEDDGETAGATTEETAAAKDGKDPKQATSPTGKDGKANAATPTGKPPKSGLPPGWPSALHGEFYKLPRAVKNEILKREGDAARLQAKYSQTAKEYAEVSKRHQGFQAALEPFIPNLKALGVAPEAAIRELFQAHHILRTGSKAEKSQLMAGLARNFDVDLAAMAAFLKGETPEETQPTAPQRRPEEVRDPRIDAMIANSRRIKSEQERRALAEQEANRQRAMLDLQEFAASGEAEHFDEVLPQMRAVQAAAAETGEDLTLKEVYERACYLNPKVRSLMVETEKQRREQQAQRTQQARTRQSVNAASSVKTEPGAPAGARKQSLDEAILGLAARYGG